MTDFFTTAGDFTEKLAALPAHNQAAQDAARARQSELTKPAGSLGRLEEIVLWLAGWQSSMRPRCDAVKALIFAGNHGVTAQGVSAFPSDVTAQMMQNYQAGGAAINQLCNAFDIELDVVGIDLDRPTKDITQAAAMNEEDCLSALNIGAEAVTPGTDILVLGEMGIGNTTIAAALSALSFGGGGSDWVGPGTGLDAKAVEHKAVIVDLALERHSQAEDDPFEILRCVGGRELAALCGAVISARHKKIPIVLDGFVVCAALAPMFIANRAITAHCLAGHVSAEPGHRRLLEAVGLTPVLDLDMRLGEGSGAAAAIGIVKAATGVHNGMATFAEAGVSERDG